MSDAYGFPQEPRLACHDVRQPTAGVLALAGAALTGAGLPRPADLVEVINEAIAAEDVTWPAGEHILACPPQRVFVPLHKVTVRRMVANVLANATRSAGPAASVIIEVCRQASRTLLAVEDGPGFGRFPRPPGVWPVLGGTQGPQAGRPECRRGSLGTGGCVYGCLPWPRERERE